MKELTITEIKQKVSESTGISLADIDSKSRTRDIVEARQIAHYFAYELTNKSLATIGRLIGNKNHATVIHSKMTIDNELSYNISVQELIQDISTQLEAMRQNENISASLIEQTQVLISSQLDVIHDIRGSIDIMEKQLKILLVKINKL